MVNIGAAAAPNDHAGCAARAGIPARVSRTTAAPPPSMQIMQPTTTMQIAHPAITTQVAQSATHMQVESSLPCGEQIMQLTPSNQLVSTSSNRLPEHNGDPKQRSSIPAAAELIERSSVVSLFGSSL